MIGMVTVTVQALGAVLVLEFYGPDIVAFFAWQALVLAISAAVTALAVNSIVPRAVKRGGIDRAVFRRVIRFALGMSGISVLSIVLTQTDKVVLSKLLSLEQFGYYSLAIVVAMSLKRLFGPLFSAFYPRLIELVRHGDSAALTHVYHIACQAMGAMVLPVSMLLMFYSWEVVYAWTGDASIADRSHILITMLVAGTALTGLTQIPYALQLAHGWTRLALTTNIICSLFFVPAVYLLGKHYGGEGAAVAWLALNLVYMFIQVPLMHRRILAGELGHWYLRDTLVPGVAAAVPLVVIAPLLGLLGEARFIPLVVLVPGYIVSVSVAIFMAHDLRAEIRRRISARSMAA
jgi:O-antigen/teichoic acid export membrane protein